MHLLYSAQVERRTAKHQGNVLVEFGIVLAILVAGLLLVVHFTEDQVADRVKHGKCTYKKYDIADPSNPDPELDCP